ncbi:MAG: hypothetical protein ACFFDT_17105 [Candidatus Hodarchaeota archaeon]
MEKELSKNLLVWGATILVIQNIIFIPSLILGAFLYSRIGGLAFAPAFWTDLTGFALIGVGIYFIGDFYTSVARFTKRTALGAFTWVILSALWRLMFGILIPIPIPLDIPIISIIFGGIAAVAFLLLMIFIKEVMNAFQEQESIGKGGSTLITVYAIIHIIGAAMIFLGYLSMSVSDTSYEGLDIRHFQRLLPILFGFLLKFFVVPLMGISTFLDVRNCFQSIEN